MLEKELEGCRKQAIFDKETAQAALSNLRQSQYEALSQLQVCRHSGLKSNQRPSLGYSIIRSYVVYSQASNFPYPLSLVP